MKYRLRINNIVSSPDGYPQKIRFVKAIKNFSGRGLKDSKMFMDSIIYNYEYRKYNGNGFEEFEFEDFIDLKEFKSNCLEVGYDVEIQANEVFKRKVNILSLGLGEKSDTIDMIVDLCRETNKDILISVLQKLDEEKLGEVIKENFSKFL